jgi:peroxin-6
MQLRPLSSSPPRRSAPPQRQMDSCYLSAHPAPATAAHVLVSASLWSSLSSATSSSIPRPASLLVAIESKYPVSYTSSDATGTTSTLLVRAELASPKFLATLPSVRPSRSIRSKLTPGVTQTSELPTVFVPPALRSSHPSIFGRPRPSNESPLPSLLLSLAHPIVLSSIVLVSHDTGSYELASKEFRTFETRLKVRGDVLRQGDTLELSEDAAGEMEGVSSSWSIVMTDPVLQGVYKEGLTRFLVLPPQQGDTGKGRLAITNGDEQKEETGEEDQGEEEEGDEFEIDESFLANSVLTPPPSAFLALPPVSPLKGEIIFNGTTLAPAPLPSSGTLITPLALLHPIPSCLLIPRPADDEDDHPRCYLRTSDLGRLGIFSGDWVRVQCEKGGRLVRAFARESVVGDSTTEVVDPMYVD